MASRSSFVAVLLVFGWSLTLSFVASTLASSLAFEEQSELDPDAEDAFQMLNILFKSREPRNFRKVYDAKTGVTRMLSFDWSDCGRDTDYVHLKYMELLPDPIQLPGNLTFTFEWETVADLRAPISLDFKLEKKVSFIWYHVPCSRIPGGCHQDDICDAISKATCPTGFPSCHCPFKSGTYSMPITTVEVKEGGIPSGDYRLTIWLKANGYELGCAYFQFAFA